MVNFVVALLSLVAGLLLYGGAAFVAPILPIDYQNKIGQFYSKYAMKSYRKAVIVQRLVGGYELLPYQVDDEKKQARVTLSSGLASSDNVLPFKDPADSVHRLYKKPVTTVYEGVPAAVDPEICEWAEATVEHAEQGGFEGDPDLEVKVDQDMQVVEPSSIARINPNSVEPEWIESCEEMTEHRFTKYNDGIGATEALATFTGFAIGIGGVVALRYLTQNVLDGEGGGGGGGGISESIPLVLDPTPLVDTVVMML